MKLIYTSNNGWRLIEQKDLLGETYISIYRLFPVVGWIPFIDNIGKSPEMGFIWLWRGNFISRDEMRYQIDLLTNKKE